jgi:hypothetical protein
MSDADLQQRAEARLDELADELIARGLVEFHEFFMPHRQTDASPPLTSEIYGIRWDEEVGGYRVYYRDMGVLRVLLECGTWDEARALFVEKVDEQSAYLRGRS